MAGKAHEERAGPVEGGGGLDQPPGGQPHLGEPAGVRVARCE
ncbi:MULTISPECIES: hypothetical protein [unclassified Pseudofrankia]|nr:MULTISPECIES: hypothetical protein [unclassified Pseudofrankia]MDT3439479.1 hypothetical protein [Pseudofrankia sp. BMG5.37]